jgi:hypothetical protein
VNKSTTGAVTPSTSYASDAKHFDIGEHDGRRQLRLMRLKQAGVRLAITLND